MKITEPEKKGLQNTQTGSIIVGIDSVLKEIIERVTPAVQEIASRHLSGEIVIQFHEGKFQRAIAKPTHHL